MQRREFVTGMSAAGAVLALSRPMTSAQAAPASDQIKIVDTNVSLFQWPFRRLPLDHTPALLEKMGQYGVVQAWAGSFEGLLQRDVAGVNERLAAECGGTAGRLIPFGTVNLALPDWEDDVRRCHEVHGMRGIRLHPNYHGYTLEDPVFARLIRLAGDRKLIVQLAVAMEDARTHHPLLTAPDVDLRPLPTVLRGVESARLHLLNVGRAVNAALLKNLVAIPGVYFETSRIEGVGGVATFLRSVPDGRVLFGTHAPFFAYEASLIKVFESGLAGEEAGRLLSTAAEKLLNAR